MRNKLRMLPQCQLHSKVPTVDKMEILMAGIIKRTDKWVEWTRVRKKWTRAIGTSARVSSEAQTTSTTTSTTTTTTSTSMGPSQSTSGGGNNPPKNNIQVLPTCRGGFLLDTGKVGDKKVEKDKEKEKEKHHSIKKDSSTILIINLDGDRN